MKTVNSPQDLRTLRPQERAAISEYLERLRARFGPRVLRVILFGSRARGEGDAESDLDVLVVVDEGDWRFRDQVADEAVEPWLLRGALISPIVMDESEYDQMGEWRTLLYRNLEMEGIELWKADTVQI